MALTEEGRRVERMLGMLRRATFGPDFRPLVDAFDAMTELLDEADEEDFFGTEGWRKRIGWND